MTNFIIIRASLIAILLLIPGSLALANPSVEPDTAINEVVLELAGTAFWNNAYYCDAVGDYVYLTMDFGLMILDVSDKTDPQIVSRLYMPTATSRLQVQGDYAYICGGGDLAAGIDWATMTIVDISDVSNPSVSGCYQDSDSAKASGIKVDGYFAYLIGTGGVHILWVFDPANPYELSNWTSYGGRDIEVVDDTVFSTSANYFFALSIIDFYNPTPVLPMISTNTGWANGIEVGNDLVYIANGDSGLTIIDPYNDQPYVLSNFPLDSGHWSWCMSLDLVLVDDTIVFIGGELSNSVKVLNVANPYAVDSVGKCGGNGDYARGMDYDNDYLYVARNEDGLFINNVSNRAMPFEVGSFRECQDQPLAIEVRGNTGYLMFKDTIKIVDLSDPANITQIGWVKVGVNSAIEVIGNLLLVGNTIGLNAIDISNPAAPVFLNTLQTGYNYVYSIKAQGDLAYISMWRYGYGVVDISDPSNLVMEGTYSDPDYWPAEDILGTEAWAAIRDGMAMTCFYSPESMQAGFLVLDVSDPANPQPVAEHVLPNQVICVTVVDSLLYFAHWNSDSLFVWNISNMLNPVQIASWRPATIQYFRPNVIANAGSYLLVGNMYSLGSYATLAVDPSAWSGSQGGAPIAALPNRKPVTDMVVGGNNVYVTSYAGLKVLTFGLNFVCGDVNGDGGFGPDVADLTYLVDYLFNGGPPPPDPLTADLDGGDGQVSVSDLTFLVDYLFRGGPEPNCG